MEKSLCGNDLSKVSKIKEKNDFENCQTLEILTTFKKTGGISGSHRD